MEESSPGVLIMGGGVSGMAAAQLLGDYDVSVHVVEKRDRLGGHAAMWACMATEACVNCGACLSFEMAADVSSRPNITGHLATVVSRVNPAEDGFDVALENGRMLKVQKIIAATGFSPFTPEKIASYHTDTLKTVITTAKLNKLLKEEAVGEVLGDNPSPEIAFIQCVGSRNRKIGRDYCSQVCCKVAMRHANKLLHIIPDARITIFYMDLQVIGKETRTFYAGLAPRVDLVQGVPAEILENRETGKLRIITEDRDDLARVAREFDMAVLAVGMEASESMDPAAGDMGLSPNSWGFFNTPDAAIARDVLVVGCARTPADILSSMQDGRIAAGRVVDELSLEKPAPHGSDPGNQPSVAVFGDGDQGARVAGDVAQSGFKTYLFGTEAPADAPAGLISMAGAEIRKVSGTAGNFRIEHVLDGRKGEVACAAVIAALEPAFEASDPGFSSENVFTPAAFSRQLAGDPDQCPQDIAILLDSAGPEYKMWARMALEDAIRARAAGKNVSVIAARMLVHKPDGQKRYDAARQAGVSFLRYENPDDITIAKTEKGFSITVKEATLPSSLDLHLECGWLVIPPKRQGPAGTAQMTALLRERIDKEGFLQSPNARHRLVRSPRKGIWFAGAGHDETDSDDLKAEIDDILTQLKTQSFDLPDVDAGVEINEKMCAQCLTCYRICPHGAIILTDTMRPRIMPDSCFSCHLCVANCPAYAIDSRAFAKNAVADMAEAGRAVVFACERSAYLAAGASTLPDDVRLVKIPCACRMNIDAILAALLKGASKIVIAGCHDGNCRSLEGAREAALGVKQALLIPGIDASRVVHEPVAANETARFKRIVSKA